MFSPRPWGCVDTAVGDRDPLPVLPTPVGVCRDQCGARSAHSVFPTPVGVCRLPQWRWHHAPSFPHARGGVSKLHERLRLCDVVSPTPVGVCR